MILSCFRRTISIFIILNNDIDSNTTGPGSVQCNTLKELHPKQCGLCTWCLPVLTSGTEVLPLVANDLQGFALAYMENTFETYLTVGLPKISVMFQFCCSFDYFSLIFFYFKFLHS